MSNLPTPNDSPAHIQPLHNPSQAAHVLPQAPLGNATNGPTNQSIPGMGARALLAKKMAKGHNPAYISPTDNLVTPVSQKLNAVKKKHFNKGSVRPMPQLFAMKDQSSTTSDAEDGQDNDDGVQEESSSSSPPDVKIVADDENPF